MLVHLHPNQFFYTDKDREESLQILGMMLELSEKCYVFGKYFFYRYLSFRRTSVSFEKGIRPNEDRNGRGNCFRYFERIRRFGKLRGKRTFGKDRDTRRDGSDSEGTFSFRFLERVAAYFGESYQKNFWDFVNQKRKQIDAILLNDFYSEFCSSKPQIDSDVLLSKAFRSFSYNELRDLLRQVSLPDLAEALKNVREKRVIQVLDFLDRESSRWLMKELMRSDESDKGSEKVKEAQLKILGIFASKKEMGRNFFE